MEDKTPFVLLFDAALDIDEDGVRERRRRGETIIDDKDIKLLQYQNRIALAKGSTVLLPTPGDADPDSSYYDIPLVCVLHPSPRCQFRWARLAVDLSATKGARIRDMAPREVRGDHPVELKTTVGLGLKFVSVAQVLSAEVKPEYSTSRTVYFPQILSSGPSFARGYWDFRSVPGECLHSNRELRLLLSAPSGVPLLARFLLRAEVSLDGPARVVPLLWKRGEIDETYRLS